jgi:LuxR family maltose regulon positive regulatory protein
VSSAVAVRSSVPPTPAATVERPRLLAALDAHRGGAFTVVSAPPGWGKTVLLSGWAAERGAAWLTLGTRHCDGHRLWADVLDALARVDVPVDELEVDPLEDDAPLRLADALAGATEPPVLVLDDLHVLRGPALAALGELLVHGGGALHVVAATRADPDLPLSRLQLSGGLGELRASELAFTLPEATALLAELGVTLRRELVERLVERTEGWAAGLRLAGLSLRGEADPDAFVADFAGDDRAVADYLTGEVLAVQPPATRELLLRASIAERVCGGLVDALTGGEGGALALEELERQGLSIVPLDRHRTWFRFHSLFAELLQARLRLEHPGLEPELHARAADWLAAAGLGREAIPHALAADGHRHAAALVADHWLQLMLDAPSPEAVIAAADQADADPRLTVSAASARLVLGDRAGAEARLAGLGPADESDAARLGALLRARAAGDLVRARELAAGLLRVPAPGRDGDALRALTLFHHGAAEFEHGRLEVAAEQLEGAAAIAVDGSRGWLLMSCLGHGAALELAEGALRRAERAARSALALAEPRGWHRTAPAAWAYATLAAVHWQHDELDDAERRADAAAAAAYGAREADAVIAARALRAHLAAARGDLDRARGLLRAARESLPDAGPIASRWMEALGPAQWAPGGPDDPVAEAADRLSRGDPLAALRRVEALPETQPELHPVLRLYSWLIAALAHHGLGRLDLASQALEQALVLAAAEGYRRPFVSGFPLRRLLERHLARPTAYGPLVAELLDALAQGGDAPPGLLEPLSERERAVLRLLPALLSNPEIAGELYVSVNTVKTHIKTIYRKLDVTSRRDAVVRARELRLI